MTRTSLELVVLVVSMATWQPFSKAKVGGSCTAPVVYTKIKYVVNH